MIELRVLGPISLKRGDGSNVASLLAQPKRLALAAYLAAPPPHGGRCFHRKDTLIGMFWPELDQHHARASLRNALYFLRTHLGPSAVVSRDDDVVGLDPDQVWCDVDAFDVAVRIRDHATAYQLYRGAMLEGVFVPDARPFEEWLDGQRQRRSVEARDAATQAARRHAAAGRLDEALVWARRARAMAPLNEDAARLLIALRHVTGDRAGALEEYQRLESLLQSEHGVPPSSDTQKLIRAVRDPNTDAASVANAIAQIPLPSAAATKRPTMAVGGRARLHARPVLEALIQTRLGLARRRGERVGVILVSLDGAAVIDDVADPPPADELKALGESVIGGIRVADLVAVVDSHTLAVLPAEDVAVDVNALIGRLTRHLQRVATLGGRATEEKNISTLWLDPASGRSATELLAEGRLPPNDAELSRGSH
ncbi:MAG TPA: BTAD domain-containing putative transcriptional regulator [Gemmatimonadaceae bacterium]|nr:BTAD domain-containing putative transcriptional regulator [Gemmatimonadaceae bacterium]